MSKSIIEVLTEARAKVAQGWCQGPPAIDAKGAMALASGDDACAWCAWGAIVAVAAYTEPGYMAEALLDDEAEKFGFQNAIKFNESRGRTKAEVLDLFDRAIAKAREPKVTTEEVERG